MVSALNALSRLLMDYTVTSIAYISKGSRRSATKSEGCNGKSEG